MNKANNKNKKCLAVLSTAAMGVLIASAVTTNAHAAVKSYITDNGAGKVISFDQTKLLTDYENKLMGVASPMFDEYLKDSPNLTAFQDDKTGYVDAQYVINAYTNALALGQGQSFKLDTVTEAATAANIKNITPNYVANLDGTVTATNPTGAVTVSSVSAINAANATVTLSRAATATDTIAPLTVTGPNGFTTTGSVALTTGSSTATVTFTNALPASGTYTIGGVSATLQYVVGLSNLNVTGQLVGTGSTQSPAVGSTLIGSNNTITLSTTLTDNSGKILPYTQVQFYTTSVVDTATSNGTTISATTLASGGQTISGTTYYKSYSVTTDSNGIATITLTNSTSGVIKATAVAPFSNGAGSITSNVANVGWGVPGSAVLAPSYTATSPEYAAISNPTNPTAGLLTFTATLIPQVGASASSVANVPVSFALSDTNSPAVSAYITDSTGTVKLASPYVVNTNAQGQATITVNATQGLTATGVLDSTKATSAANITATPQNGFASNTVYAQWGQQNVATKLASISPANAVNDNSSATAPFASNIQVSNSGSNVTINAVVQDVTGNPVPNAKVYVVPKNSFGTNEYVNNGVSTLFSATSVPVLTSDASGNISVTVSDTAATSATPTKDKYNFYVLNSGVAAPTTFATNNVVPFGTTSIGSAYVVWQQAQNAAQVGIAATGTAAKMTTEADPLQVSYSALTGVPSTASTASGQVVPVNTVQKFFVGLYNNSGTTIDPNLTAFNGITETYTVSAPVGYVINNIGGATIKDVATNTAGVVNGAYVNSVTYTVGAGGAINIIQINGANLATANVLKAGDPAVVPGTATNGHVIVGVNTAPTASGLTANTTGGAATVAVNATAVSGSGASAVTLGSSSSTVNFTWTASNVLTSLNVDTLGVSDITGTNSTFSTSFPAGLNASAGLQGSEQTFAVGAYNSSKSLITLDQNGVTAPSSMTFNVTAPGNAKITSIDGIALASSVSQATVVVTWDGSTYSVSVNGNPLSGSLASYAHKAFIQVGVTDDYAETANVTTTVGSTTATAALTYNATSATVDSVVPSAATVTTSYGASNQVTYTVLDANGTPVPNANIALTGPANNDLWITQVNGTNITQTIGTNGTQPTPVPLYKLGANAGYSTVTATGINATGIGNSTAPNVALTTDSNGKVTITLQAGNVAYFGTGSAVTTSTDYTAASGLALNATSVNGKVGAVQFNLTGPAAPTSADLSALGIVNGTSTNYQVAASGTLSQVNATLQVTLNNGTNWTTVGTTNASGTFSATADAITSGYSAGVTPKYRYVVNGVNGSTSAADGTVQGPLTAGHTTLTFGTNTASDTITLAGATELAAGTYTITASGITGTATVTVDALGNASATQFGTSVAGLTGATPTLTVVDANGNVEAGTTTAAAAN